MTDIAAYAEACAAVYADPVTWHIGSAHVLIAENAGLYIVSFRGSQDLADWLIDFTMRPVWHPVLGWCHSGFLNDVLGVSDRMLADLAGKRVVVTGHSKGGAEAVIFAGLMVASGHPPEAVVTFGAPRAGFAMLRDVLNTTAVIQFRNGNDPVPEVLPEIAFWRHAREPLQAIGTWTFDPFDSHLMESYRKALPL